MVRPSARGDGLEDGPRRFGGHVDHVAVDRVIQRRQQQPLRFRFGELVIRVLPDVVHAAGGKAHQEAAVLGASDARADQVVEREGGIERHVGFVLVLAEPGGHVGVAVVAILVEDHHDAADLALDLLELAHVDAAFVPLANGLAQVDAIENRRGERLHAHALLGENALALFLEKTAVVLDHQIFGRVGADAGAVQLAGPFAGNLLFLARLQAVGAQLLLGVGQAAAQADAARVDPDLFAGDAHGRQIALGALRRIGAGGLPDVPGVVVVGDAAGGHREIEDAGRRDRWPRARDCGYSAPAGGAASGRCARRCWPRTPSRRRGRRRVARGADRSGWRRSAAGESSRSATAGRGYSSRISASDSGCGLSSSMPSRRARAMGCACGSSMASSTGSSRFSETTTSTLARGFGALQFPGDAGGVARQIVRPRLRLDAVGLDVARQADVADRVRIRVGVLQVGALAGVGIGEDDLGADFEAGADGLGERVGRFDGNVDGLVLAGVLVRVEDDARSPAGARRRAARPAAGWRAIRARPPRGGRAGSPGALRWRIPARPGTTGK